MVPAPQQENLLLGEAPGFSEVSGRLRADLTDEDGLTGVLNIGERFGDRGELLRHLICFLSPIADRVNHAEHVQGLGSLRRWLGRSALQRLRQPV
jgi:hypothetical protein